MSKIFSNFTFYIVVGSAVISFSRIIALWKYYHAPQTVYFELETTELPRLLEATGLVPTFPPNTPVEEIPRLDLSPVKLFNLTLCVGKEWHRFPGHYLVPDGVRVDFVKSDFDGLLPGHFGEGPPVKDSGLWWRKGTRSAPAGLNDVNREAPAFYVRISDMTSVFSDADPCCRLRMTSVTILLIWTSHCTHPALCMSLATLLMLKPGKEWPAYRSWTLVILRC